MPASMLLRKFPSSSVGLVGNDDDDEKGTTYLSSLISSSTKHKSPLVVVVVTTSNYFKHYYYSLCRHCHFHFLLLLSFFLLLLCFSSMWFFSASATNNLPIINNNNSKRTINNCTSDVSVYVYELPAKFNRGLLHNCRHLNIYTDMCPHVANRGLGQPISMLDFNSSWYATHQFIAEMIFHARLQNHPCRTRVPGDNTLFYIPFYGGLHASSKFREANLTERDLLGVELVEYVSQQRWWKRKQGRDHFLVLGRTAWDFMRTDDHDFGANNFLNNLPGVKNMSVLTVERHPWEGHNQFGIPYPSYLHPMSSDQVEAWQAKMRDMKRPHLFSFVGAPRRGVEKASIRDEIIRQCESSSSCYLLDCGRAMSRCHDASQVLGVMTRSQFCLQAPGDSFTRRSTFDSVLAGCIPVFFSVHTAYTQYGWYLPKDAGDYSVYIPAANAAGNNNIEERLKSIPSEEAERMRNTVIGLIPRLTYMHPNATTSTTNNFKDAVDVALQQLSHFVNSNSSIRRL